MEDSYIQQTKTTNGRQLNKDSYRQQAKTTNCRQQTRQLMGDN